eukprot:g1120.t1 g1120   contig10:1426997-1428679(+)
MSHLSELSVQLRKLQSENNSKASEIDRLERHVRILSDLQGIHINDLRDALRAACEGEAHDELRSVVGKLQAQLDELDTSGGPGRVRGISRKFGKGGQSEEDQNNIKSQAQFNEEAAARARTTLELRIGELEELECTLRSELTTLYEKQKQLTERNTYLETQNLQQQALLEEWERRWKARDEVDAKKTSVVPVPMQSTGSYNYSEFAVSTNSGPARPALLLHNQPQSQVDTQHQQRMLAAEAALAGEKQHRALLQSQLESLQKSSQLKIDQQQHRIQFLEGQINDLEQQMNSLYAAFGIVQTERVEERDQKLWLKRNLLESDAALAKEADEKERHSVVGGSAARDRDDEPSGLYDLSSYKISARIPSTPPPVTAVKPAAHPPIVEGVLLLLLEGHDFASPSMSKKSSTKSSPFSPRKFLSKSKSSSQKMSSAPTGSAVPKFKRQYCVLHGANGLYQLRYGDSYLGPVAGVHEFITTGVSSVEHTPRSSTKDFGFEIKINANDEESSSLCCAAESEEDFMMWMAGLMGVIDGSYGEGDDECDEEQEENEHVPSPAAFRPTSS